MQSSSAAVAFDTSGRNQALLWLLLPVLATALISGAPSILQLTASLGGLHARIGQPKAAAPVAPTFERQRAKLCLSQAVYYEARGESVEGQAAVAQVVLNRVRARKFPKSVCEVVFQGAQRGHSCQFSFACDGSMNRALSLEAWTRAETVAAQVLGGYTVAAVGTATHYHTRRVSPGWSGRMTKLAVIGAHVFYADKVRAAPKVQTA